MLGRSLIPGRSGRRTGVAEPVRRAHHRPDVGKGPLHTGSSIYRLIVILIANGTKKHQNKDIQDAQHCWADYKRRKKQETQ
jgi:hypothetical protein